MEKRLCFTPTRNSVTSPTQLLGKGKANQQISPRFHQNRGNQTKILSGGKRNWKNKLKSCRTLQHLGKKVGFLSLFTAPKWEEKTFSKRNHSRTLTESSSDTWASPCPWTEGQPGCLGYCGTELLISSVGTGDSDNPEHRVLCLLTFSKAPGWTRDKFHAEIQANQETSSPSQGRGSAGNHPEVAPWQWVGLDALSGPFQAKPFRDSGL